jgi:hypothetical protein
MRRTQFSSTFLLLAMVGSGCGGRSVAGWAPTDDIGYVVPRDGGKRDFPIVKKDGRPREFRLLDGNGPRKKDIKVIYNEAGRTDGSYGRDACQIPGGNLDNLVGQYAGKWNGWVSCSGFGMDIPDSDLSINLLTTAGGNTLDAEGFMKSPSMSGVVGTISGSLDCSMNFSGTLQITISSFGYTLNGGIDGSFQPTWGLPPHFGDGTWWVEDPAMGCKASGKWWGTY